MFTIDFNNKAFGAISAKRRLQSPLIRDYYSLLKKLCSKLLANISEYKTLSELCSITTGKLDANANNPDGLYPFFTCGKETLSIDTYAFDGEAILIAGNGDIGYTKYYNGKFNAYQRTYVLMNFKANALFVKMDIDSYLPAKILEETQGGAMPYIKLTTLSSLQIPCPKKSKQQEIVKQYRAIDKKLENEIRYAKLLQHEKKYLLNAMFI